MFTGIIEEVGKILLIQRKGRSMKLVIRAEKIVEDIKPGDSIAVNGICLTVTSQDTSSFMADVMHETLHRTSMDCLQQGSLVNLERAMSANGRFGGHIVTGHIDGTGIISRIERDSIAIWYTIQTTAKIAKHIIEKGSVAIDGISLTVASVSKDSFRVSVIPHTLLHTSLGSKKVNDTVNLENDCIGKYVEKFIVSENTSNITREFLLNNGY